MDELVQWLHAQLDEDERTARATVWDGSGNKLDWELIASATIDVGGDQFYVGDRTIANHMMAWQPARVLREIDATRKAVELHTSFRVSGDPWPGCNTCSWRDEMEDLQVQWPCPTLRLFALPYADRPGYREEWRP